MQYIFEHDKDVDTFNCSVLTNTIKPLLKSVWITSCPLFVLTYWSGDYNYYKIFSLLSKAVYISCLLFNTTYHTISWVKTCNRFPTSFWFLDVKSRFISWRRDALSALSVAVTAFSCAVRTLQEPIFTCAVIVVSVSPKYIFYNREWCMKHRLVEVNRTKVVYILQQLNPIFILFDYTIYC